jgi:uncharacterized protein YgbK (DUF1537 family)
MGPQTPIDVVLDDDPTGVQAVSDVPVLLAWDRERLLRAGRSGSPSVHLMTNVRALPPEHAERVTFEAATAAREALPGSRIVLRGDSTLRGHLLEEYRAVTRAAYGERSPVLVLVPALPAAGRVTIGGVHWLEAPGGERVRMSETEYARDGGFAYRSSHLLEWAEERTSGLIAAAAGTELPLETLRVRGGEAVAEAIARAATSGEPAACAPDAQTIDDLELIADGVRQAEALGVPLLVRCAPAFAGVLSGTLATGFVDAPAAGRGGVLVACGSYVSGTTRQLRDLCESFGIEAIEPDLHALASGSPGAEIERTAARASEELVRNGLALVSTPRERPADLVDLAAGERIAHGLGAIVAAVEPGPDVVVAKGGITSQVVLETGLGAHEARVAGPVAAGVALWNVESRGRRVAYLVFPGNVGDQTHLTRVVRLVRGE